MYHDFAIERPDPKRWNTTTHQTGGVCTEVATTEEEQRRSQGSRSPIVPPRPHTHLSPNSVNCLPPGHQSAESGAFHLPLTCRINSKRSFELISHSLFSLISVKIHGLINAPRATMTPSTPLYPTFSQYSCEENTSPPPKIGIGGTV